jgi:epoxyqueuosine reductase
MTEDKSTQIIEKAKSFGASLAGIASVDLVKTSPSYELHEKILKDIDGIGFSMGITEISKEKTEFGSTAGITDIKEIKWPENAKSALVIALSHPLEKPQLDWYLESGFIPGNWYLEEINRKLTAWIEEKYGIKTHHVNYWIGQGGMYLKDSAVLSGLGCIGKNNLLITPEFGPRVRFRSMLLDEELTPTGPIDFNPCDGCEEFCRKLCPQNAFDEIVLSSDKTEMSPLPARNGSFSRPKCSIQSGLDVQGGGFTMGAAKPGQKMEGTYQTKKYMIWCRRCELACPVGA